MALSMRMQRGVRLLKGGLPAPRSRGFSSAVLARGARFNSNTLLVTPASRMAAPLSGFLARSFSSKPIKTPNFGAESITEGTIMEWKVKAGDHVKKGDILVIIETDKVSVDVAAEEDGTITEIIAKPDDTVEVGKPLCNFTPGAAGAAPAKSAEPAKKSDAAPAAASGDVKIVEVKTPEFGAESITEGTMQEWKYKVGDYVKEGELIAAIETDKVSVDVSAPASGILEEILLKPDETAEVGMLLCKIKTGGVPPPAPPAGGAAPAAEAPKAPEPAAAAPKKEEAPKEAAPAVAGRSENRVKMPRMRQAIAKNLKGAQETQATLSTFNEVDMTGLMAMRKEYKDIFEKVHGCKFGLQSVFFKAAANALVQVPSVNATIEKNEIVYRDYVDIGFAAATPRGLVVPVIRNVESLDLVGIEKSFAELAGKAKADKMTMADMEGGTFSISNGGVFGSMLGTPMIGSTNLSAVMGLHGTKMRATVVDGSIKARPIMYVALTYDHRLIDGREAVTFLNLVKQQVETPERMILGL
eukprot:CAMPEP_0206445882 /NCGR_PEP_ID=MMETSP0324_2-20121206/15792_1 /ASSEMBLY_ACC=CAM_ASM_000836 /TAXON_ID=2866 /ORGANISM="Crypthecodinium cohnii, Strain Seligo" /LENGTH=526 /DNA_ID=CAMNT_0053914221 /DNA_START=106 /DNA_END=1686 /DNA_ORIENTATION=+